MLETQGLCRTFTSDAIDYEVLKGIEITIKKGESVAIVGKSGSGKSTLMHLLACLDEPTSGSVSFEGRDYSRMSEKQRDRLRNEKFGFVFQQFFLNGRETVYENVVLPMRIRGASEKDLKPRALEALESVGLGDKSEKRAKDLSGGEKQRVCIARAIVGDPDVVFADEPTGNLDSKTSRTIEDLLLDLNRENGITVVIVTHDEDLARKCGRTIDLKDGRVRGVEPVPAELFAGREQ
ncbi:MAG: ABC transporter ATP-binding protein [Acidobacteria bacterium]|nr:MAG: ABC transporter ATP-binding protein [Acidobacteriota bacterium]REK04008.1 MAG: ABC transporter ATP-binding protein [Acidobacteriota bacterium]REK15170.1 MAG: ABC transporter ATP-binding protein [Acidobacteriota bacterium]REK46260.1 MAG: ABC transporter ATP-binding protein [Acidobacteriota bacterium]